MNNLYEALEICLQEIEQGADIDTVLFRYPDLVDELRPILEASRNASSMAIPVPSVEVMRRNRAKVLQHAAQMREAKVKVSSQRVWRVSLRRAAVTLVVVAALFISGTNLVRAASTTLPGDNLYPVKRTWEDMLLLFTFNSQQREALEVEHENERLHELRELLAEGRSEDVDFAGVVTSQNGNEWVVSPGITVLISAQTEIRDQGIVIGSAVRVKGETQGNGIVLAERIRLSSPDEKLPDLDDKHEGEKESHEGENKQENDNSGKGSGDDEPKDEETKEPESDSEKKDESSNDGSGSDKSGSDSDDNDSSEDNSGSSNDGSDGSSHDSSDDSGGDGDNSGSGGEGGDD
ncbi:MAG: hypothetical protein EHM33_15640 [Chloroflexi bacterium]|nr:MAG: hypothetical protein EHM33_15640 [Chloroflexota bacterium]